ncbi:Crp/Fnr family transcriptional regulator [Vogesella sp. LIG4]|uniref:Crp/Fnr family transcriptional regulator n=1 Tax=Vogesella sp. LIG4 TaxID=1192162 RepID=UPI00081FC328|nr:Crp/Fnr family transcriptional regulator [Vogesella sp. LIG4]SCK19402.1 cAMP-binding domain of CRP or a regulatory subunit of cAMP-dependent protein kinases [Vogesella sp. LIG4]
MSPIDVSAFLSHQPLFQQLSPAQLQALVPATRELRGLKGQVIFQRGDTCDGMYLLVYGKVKLALSSNGGVEKVVEILHPGQSFGEAVMFLNQPFPVMAQFIEDGLLLHVSSHAIRAAIVSDPGFAQRMLAGLALRLHNLMRDVARYSVENASQRVAGYLLQLQRQRGDSVVRLAVNKNVIASRLNITPETFSRVLHSLVEQGAIAVRGRDIDIIDPPLLQQLETQ